MPEQLSAPPQAYLQSTRSIVSAGEQLLQSLEEGKLEREMAIAELDAAARVQESGGAEYRRFMFSGLEGAAPAAHERLADDTLASLLLEMRVANVLLAAGVASGEGGATPQREALAKALHRLERDVQQFESGVAAPSGETAPGRFAFIVEVAPAAAEREQPTVEVVQSESIEGAIRSYEQCVEETLAAFIDEARGAVVAVFDALSKLDAEKVSKALSELGVQAKLLPRIGRLISAAVRRLKAFLDSLVRLIGVQVLGKAREQVDRVWQEFKAGRHVDSILRWAFAVDEARDYALAVSKLRHGSPAALDGANTELRRLALRFQEAMKLSEALITVTASFGVLAATVFPASAPEAALALATVYGLVLAYVLFTGLDYTDGTDLLGRVPGIRQVADQARPA